MRSKTSTMRGRLPGKISRVDIGLLEYLFKISMKHGIDSDKFFEKVVSAWRHQESTCKGLRIVCRKRTRDNAHAFLFTSSHGVIAQFPIPERILVKTNPLKEFTYTKSLRSHSVKEKVKVNHLRIENLRAGMKLVEVKARVLEIPEPRLVFTRFGSSAIVTNILIGDETGTIRLSLWNEQIKTVSVDNVIQIENARVAAFRGERQLRIGKNGKLRVIKDAKFPSAEELKKLQSGGV